MPPKVKKTRLSEPKALLGSAKKEKQMENEKENKSPELEQRRRRNARKINKVYFEETEIEDSSKSSSKLPKSDTKPLGFWSKKLKDLEENKKSKKCELYDFSGTDESEYSYKRKKKPKQKTKLKKKQTALSRPFKITEKTSKVSKPETKTKKIHTQSLCREQIILNKERKKLADRGEKFTFSTGIASLGITSTPEVNKDNLVGASNFLFLSPINKDTECHKKTEVLTPEPAVKDKDASSVHLGQETPKVETKLKRISCRRVLRSGKMLNT